MLGKVTINNIHTSLKTFKFNFRNLILAARSARAASSVTSDKSKSTLTTAEFFLSYGLIYKADGLR